MTTIDSNRTRLSVAFYCNDARNGAFTGSARAAHLRSLCYGGRIAWNCDLVCADCCRGAALAVDDARMKLRIHRVWFPFKEHLRGSGNWCWDSFVFERVTGKRLLYVMRDSGMWNCECWPSALYRWWNKRPSATHPARA